MSLKPFTTPVYVTRPVLPELAGLMSRLSEVWGSGILSNGGSKHVEFERRLADYIGPGHISLFNNGTIALLVAIKALELTGEVLVTPFTFAATPHVLAWNNITPVFVDILDDTMTIDPARLEEAITPRTTGILGVHVYGNHCDVAGIGAVAHRHNLKVVYDAAHAFGAKIDGTHVGMFGDATMFSFHPTKLFHSGEGGAVLMQDENLKARVDLLKNFGIVSEHEVDAVGINGKMNEIQASLGLCVLDYVDREREARLQVANVYRNRLGNLRGVTVSDRVDPLQDSLQYFYARIDAAEAGVHRDRVYDGLKEFNIFARKYFFPLCSNYACYQSHPSSSASNLPVANRAAEEVLCLPFYGELGVERAERICDAFELILAAA